MTEMMIMETDNTFKPLCGIYAGFFSNIATQLIFTPNYPHLEQVAIFQYYEIKDGSSGKFKGKSINYVMDVVYKSNRVAIVAAQPNKMIPLRKPLLLKLSEDREELYSKQVIFKRSQRDYGENSREQMTTFADMFADISMNAKRQQNYCSNNIL